MAVAKVDPTRLLLVPSEEYGYRVHRGYEDMTKDESDWWMQLGKQLGDRLQYGHDEAECCFYIQVITEDRKNYIRWCDPKGYPSSTSLAKLALIAGP